MDFDELLQYAATEPDVNVCLDSRCAQSGDIFVAVRGTAVDGHDFIESAVEAGATHVVGERAPAVSQAGTEWIVVENSAKAAAMLAQAKHGYPASKLTNLAVTGTNGKTTVAFLVHSCIRNAGAGCGLVGTVAYDTGSGCHEAPLTTPDSLTIAAMQAEMVQAGAGYMIAEASSHALSQDRLAGINFEAAAFTNLTGDHLDYHKTEAGYLAAKSRLFEQLRGDATAVLNAQSPHASRIAQKTGAGVLWYAVDEPADIVARIKSMDVYGTVFDLEFDGEKSEVRTPLLGLYNISNHLAAAGLCLSAGFDLGTVAAGLGSLEAVPGRLEKVDSDCGFAVLIDYAHTDDALKNVLSTLKPLCKGRLTVVFGCGGDRDKTKRPRMAKVAEKFADKITVTSDNPRTEDADSIIEDIMAGFTDSAAEKITIEVDRRKAIAATIRQARVDDIILIAGKGHETYQVIGTEKSDFSDKEIASEYLRARK